MTSREAQTALPLSRARSDGQVPSVPRAWIWVQLLFGWLPVGALFAVLILTAHEGSTVHAALVVALRGMIAAAMMGVAVYRFTRRVPWPDTISVPFVATQLLAAAIYSIAWVLLNSVLESVLRAQLVFVVGSGLAPYLVLGVWLYVMTAGIAYAIQATQRAARAEALAASSQLAALRAQLNPHFLFNALHTVVHLIPREPARASKAAEQVASLLRTTLEEDRELVSLADEWEFVRRYLDVEQLRFGDRLVVRAELSDEAREALIPPFAVQTLVENAVRHGATPRIEPTTITVTGRNARGLVSITVHDDGMGAELDQINANGGNGGTGLKRLRDRLSAMYGDAARLDISSSAGRGLTAVLYVPSSLGDEAHE